MENNETVRVLYIHGYGSSVDATGKHRKYQALSRIGPVTAVAPNYDLGPSEVMSQVGKIIINESIDLIVGTSMGGWLASHLGPSYGVPYVALNPAISPGQSLLKYPGAREVAPLYEDFTAEGCCNIYVEMGDDVIDPRETIRRYQEKRPLIALEGGSHRFESLEKIIPEIKVFLDGSVVDGF